MPTTEEKFQSIDSNTQSKISEGFEFQGKRFSLSLNSQITMTNLYLACKSSQDDLAINKAFALPFVWNTKDDKDYIVLSNPSTVSAFYAAGLAAVAAALKSGTTQKVGVRYTDLNVPLPVLPSPHKSASELFDIIPTTSEEVGVAVPPEPDQPISEEIPPPLDEP